MAKRGPDPPGLQAFLLSSHVWWGSGVEGGKTPRRYSVLCLDSPVVRWGAHPLHRVSQRNINGEGKKDVSNCSTGDAASLGVEPC